jgi:DNA modification methylase
MLLAMDEPTYKLSQTLVWLKNNHVLSRMDYLPNHEFIQYGWKKSHKFYGEKRRSVFEWDRPHSSELHPTMKPVGLIASLIKDGSQKGMIVYDPFLGSGSTLIAAEQLGRKCYGLEISPQFCDVIVQRWENETGLKASRIR